MRLSSGMPVSKMIESPARLKLFFIRHLPMAFLAGLRIRSADENHATVSLPYKYLTKNPFRSTYFACQAMAAEFSTGIMCLQALDQFDSDISLLVVKVEADFLKKATDTVLFTCKDEDSLFRTVEESVRYNDARKVSLQSIGSDSQGNTVAEFTITWSFKPRI